MTWRSVWAFALTAGLAAPQALLAQSQDTRPGIAVMTFENGGSMGPDKETLDGLQVGLQQMVITELGQNPQLRLVDRGRIKDLLAEQDLGAGGRVDANTAAKIGRLVGARYMVLGGFIDWNGDFTITAQVVNVETSEYVKTVKVHDDQAKLYSLVVQLANTLTKDLSLPALPRQAMEQRESRKVPTEALTLYSRALLYQDRGDTQKAAELFNKAIAVFPDYTEAREGLRQLKQG
jgi:TolB-like protein